ncbi:MAG: hypothetical protein AB7G17_05300 [Phycisphaerales bacterium]
MTKTLSLIAIAALAGSANAALLASETFSYANGNLVGNGAWAAHSGAGNSPVQVNNGMMILEQGSGSREDVNLTAGGPIGAGQTWYASFDMKNTGGNGTVYFAHFLQGTSNFDARVFITAPTAGGDYTIGFASSSTIAATWASDLSFGTFNKIVIAFTQGTGVARLWINPNAEGDTHLLVNSGFPNTLHEGIGFRQAAGDSTQMIDNVYLGTTFADVVPAPGPAALLALAGVAVARRRRA